MNPFSFLLKILTSFLSIGFEPRSLNPRIWVFSRVQFPLVASYGIQRPPTGSQNGWTTPSLKLYPIFGLQVRDIVFRRPLGDWIIISGAQSTL
ncbi:Ovarian cancer-associated gene 2 protein -like protein [Caligus rogercresseyi]|uniref:Ovarian cancer-associated gene 2 protein -like protein n=1 Tax=Caligus rogercresseyi TaxID=217165 RepID=A0A7T8GX76_CALRO|nr:Ovarian cancer-associated gene 2 protein -like protein [Caligus rogercresseyi]